MDATGRQNAAKVERRGQRVLRAEVVRQLSEQRRQHPARRSADQHHADHSDGAGGAAVHEMQFHLGPLAVKGVLARAMEVELLQLVGNAVERQHIVTLGLDLHGVPVVEDVPRGLAVLDRDRLVA